MVILVLTYCLPQPQHHAPGALARVSLALRPFLEPVWSLFGALFGAFSEPCLEPFRSPVWSLFGAFSEPCLEPFWSPVWSLFGVFLEPTWSRELYNQLATQPGPLGCIAPTATLQATPRPLKRATEACFAPRKGLNSRGSFSSPHLDAFLTCLKAKIAIFLYAFNFPGTFERLSYYYYPLC